MQKDAHKSAAERRQQAEAIALEKAARLPEDRGVFSPEEARRTLHELRVHQVELEMQNEELCAAQVELDAARACYFDLYDLAPTGYATVSEQGLILEANLAAANLLGATRGALVKQPVSRFVLPEDQDIYHRHCKQLFEARLARAGPAGMPQQACELRMVKMDGAAFWARLEAACAENADGAPVCRVVLSDVTASRRAAQVLVESAEDKFKSIFDHAGDGIVLVDPENKKFFTGNNALCRMLGYSREEIENLGVMDIHTEKDLPHVVAQFEGQARGDFALAKDMPVKRKDGSVIYADINTTAIIVAGKKYLAGFFHDTTARRQAEAALLFKAMLLEAQSETSIDGILAVDNSGRSILFNKRFGEIWKIPRHVLDTKDDAAMLAHVAQQLKDPAEFKHKVAYLYEHKDEKSRDEIEFADGRCFDRYSSPLVSADGKYHGRIWYFRDITARRQAEDEIRKLNASLEQRVQARTTELAHANQELETLIRIASHDLRSPLVNIQGFNQLLNKACDAIMRILADAVLPDDTRRALAASHEKAAKAMRFINAGVEKISGLISGLLRLSQVGRAPLVLQPLDMNALVQDVLEAMAFQIRTAAAAVTADALPACRADAALINQVFSNLLDNAVKYRDRARPLQVRVWGRHPGRDCREDARVVYCVADNGMGVAPEHQQKIWDLFYRIDPQGSGAGEGIGLTAVQRIVERHGGTVWLESEIGKGSRFFLSLPAAAKETEP